MVKHFIGEWFVENANPLKEDIDSMSESLLSFVSYGLTIMWGLNPKILLTNSALKPFITDITIIRIATPRAIPKKEKIEINFKKPSFFLGLKYLNAIILSTFEINLNFFCWVIYS